jgi:hypothetical protein
LYGGTAGSAAGASYYRVTMPTKPSIEELFRTQQALQRTLDYNAAAGFDPSVSDCGAVIIKFLEELREHYYTAKRTRSD